MARDPETYYSDELFETGLGDVVVCRFKNDGRIEAGIFLIDVFCLGVIDATFAQFDNEEEFREEYLNERLPDVKARPGSWGRKLVEHAAQYARNLGFAPHSDYKKGARVFGGIAAEDCPETFVFGRDGRPYFIPGPTHTPDRLEQIHTILQASVGLGGYDSDDIGFDDDESLVIYAMDSQGQDGDPSILLSTMANDFLDQHPEFAEVVYTDIEHSSLAEEVLNEALDLLATAAAEFPPDITLDGAVRHVQMMWNLQALPPEQREVVFQDLPPEDVAMMREAFEGVDDNPDGTERVLIHQFLVLQADEPGNERLLLLCQVFDQSE